MELSFQRYSYEIDIESCTYVSILVLMELSFQPSVFDTNEFNV